MLERAYGVEVLIAARDANFLRLAATVLSQAGRSVETTADRLGRVERLMCLHTPEVLVLEGDRRRVMQVRARVAASTPRAAIVLVVDDDDDTPTEGADVVVAKWGRPALLLEAVELARHVGGATGRHHLRLIQG